MSARVNAEFVPILYLVDYYVIIGTVAYQPSADGCHQGNKNVEFSTPGLV